MAIELRFSKKDNHPWGFRLTGGSDHDFPLTVVKIVDGSHADRAGLKVGDVLLKIQDTNTDDLTHEQAHESLLKLDQEFTVKILRGDLTDIQLNLIADEDRNEEVYNILEGSIPIEYEERPYPDEQTTENISFVKHDLNLTDEEVHRIINPENFENSATLKELKKNENLEHVSTEEQRMFYVANAEVKSELYLEQTIEKQVNTQILIQAERNQFEEMQSAANKVSAQHVHSSQICENEVLGKSEVLKAINTCLSDLEIEERKWSTFLQKPKNPKPIVKEEELKENQYKVVIRTKKDLEIERATKKAEKEAAVAMEIAAEESRIEAERAAYEATLIAEEETYNEINVEMKEANKNERRKLEEEDDIINKEITVEIEPDYDSVSEKSEENMTYITGTKKSTLSIEQQLSQVKEQLSALSDLPQTIQMTLSLITQQLQKIAHNSQSHEEEMENEFSCAENTDTEDEITELVILESQDALSIVEEESENRESIQDFLIEEQRCLQSSELEASVLVKTMSLEEDIMDQEDIDMKLIEEIEEKKNAQLKIDKQAKINHWNHIWPWTHVTQPIYRESNCCLVHSKVIETKKINFLKFQPPPKKMDHLQHSEVYKIIHDLEPPAKGILARPEMILSEEDYFTKKNENNQISPQMER
ncbi:PREDICTED: titin homolog isoform X2 [Nicrophorus vespilloides]|uniref:Titin homolog isoform X2 n=1 Tax=Nicrophorus vespilloides TaxID=110193 RepID=A0ABM1NCQ3_NICVS|nr:PREDICTED: titin homolog isoform X2 [Nicrophorus vespilloides]